MMHATRIVAGYVFRAPSWRLSWSVREYDIVKSYTEAFEQGATGIPASRIETGARMIMVKDGEAR